MILVVDFGSQTTHLIARRLKELGASTEITTPQKAVQLIKSSFAKASADKKLKPLGIVLSGGPASVYEKHSPTISPDIFAQNIPILGICYGLQLTAHLLGGKVIPGKKEYGPAKLQIAQRAARIAHGLPQQSVVWMSHGDEVVKLPKGFEVLGSTPHVAFAFVQNQAKHIYGLQFHPEVEHTEWGSTILKNFIEICSIKTAKKNIDISSIQQAIRERVGEAYVIGAVSGGVDSTVAGVLTAQAIGDHFVPVYIENGLMREGTEAHVKKIFTERGRVKPIIVESRGEMLRRLAKISDPEK